MIKLFPQLKSHPPVKELKEKFSETDKFTKDSTMRSSKDHSEIDLSNQQLELSKDSKNDDDNEEPELEEMPFSLAKKKRYKKYDTNVLLYFSL